MKFAVPSGYLACSGRFRIQVRIPESEVYLPYPPAGLNLWRRPLKNIRTPRESLRKSKKVSRIHFLRACFCVLFFRACFRRRFGVHFSRFSTYFSPIFHEKPSIPYIILQSAKITTWLLFRLAPASCDFASCFAMSSKGEFSGFRGAKTC